MQLRWSRRRRAGSRARERGTALVEFALVAPVLFCLVMGTITGGLALSAKNSMSNAAREGARLGATVPVSGSASTWANDVRDRVREVATGDLTNDQICVRLVNSADVTVNGAQVLGSACASIAPPALPAAAAGTAQCAVKVWVHRTASVEAIFFTRAVALDASTVARFERGSGTACAG